jgi:di/tricarboxylate transporter
MQKLVPQIPQLTDVNMVSLAWRICWNSVFIQGIVTLAGFAILGGLAWIAANRKSDIRIDDIAPKPEPFTNKQIYTLIAIAILIGTLIITGLPSIKPSLPKWFLNITSNLGTIALILAAILSMLEAADVKKSLASVPWGVLIMIGGITCLINVMEKAGGLKILVDLIASISTPVTVNGWLGLFTGIISAYSSSSGVVMPTFLPLVPGLMEGLNGAADAIAMMSSINIGAHIVDTSPLSTCGAVCIACASETEDKVKLFRNLLFWGLSMSVVGALACMVFLGILGL